MKRARPDDALAQADPLMQRTLRSDASTLFSNAYDKHAQGAGSLQQPACPGGAQIASVYSGVSSDQLGTLEAFSMGYPPRKIESYSAPSQLQPPYAQHQQQGYSSSSNMMTSPGSLPHSNSSSFGLLPNQPDPLLQRQQYQQHILGHYNPALASGDLHGAGPGSLSTQLQAQQQHQQQPGVPLHRPQDLRPLRDLQQLLPQLNQEYKREMQLLLQACKVASWVQKQNNPSAAAAAPNGSVLLLDPASRDQLQQQVLNNCNEKHRAIVAAFRLAAQAVAAAVRNTVADSRPGADAAAAAVDLISGSAAAAAGSSMLNLAAAQSGPLGQHHLESGQAREAVAETLQQLRSCYHQELVAATSALFAICRGFGQSTTVTAAASQPVKRALAAAQQQHNRVEQLWRDLLAA